MSELDYTIIELAKKGVIAGDICHRLNISKQDYYNHIRKIQSILHVYKEQSELENLPNTKIM